MQAKSPISVAPISALLAGLFLVALGNGLQGTLIAVRAGQEGLSEESIGVIMSAYFIGYVVGTLFAPKLVIRVGHIRTFASLASITSAVTLAHLMIIEPVSWSIFRSVNGFCIAGIAVVIESWLNGHAAPGNRGQILSIYGLLIMAGVALGQLLLNFSDPSDFYLFCLVSILISLALVPVSMTKTIAPTVTGAQKINFGQLFAISPVTVLGTLIAGLTIASFSGMGPTFAQKIGLDTAGIATFMAVIMFGSMVFQWPLGWLSDQIDRRFVIAFVSFANSLVCFGFIMLTSDETLYLYMLAFLLGGFGIPLYSLCVALANDRVDTKDMLTTASTLLMVFGVGSVFGPFLTSLSMGQLGSKGLFVFIGVFYILLAFISLIQIRKKTSVKKEERKAVFVSTYAATRVGLELDIDTERDLSTIDQVEK